MNCFFQSLIWLGRVAGAMEFMPFADDRQCILLFEDLKDHSELKVSSEFSFALAFHTGLNLARYPT